MTFIQGVWQSKIFAHFLANLSFDSDEILHSDVSCLLVGDYFRENRT